MGSPPDECEQGPDFSWRPGTSPPWPLGARTRTPAIYLVTTSTTTNTSSSTSTSTSGASLATSTARSGTDLTARSAGGTAGCPKPGRRPHRQAPAARRSPLGAAPAPPPAASAGGHGITPRSASSQSSALRARSRHLRRFAGVGIEVRPPGDTIAGEGWVRRRWLLLSHQIGSRRRLLERLTPAGERRVVLERQAGQADPEALPDLVGRRR